MLRPDDAPEHRRGRARGCTHPNPVSITKKARTIRKFSPRTFSRKRELMDSRYSLRRAFIRISIPSVIRPTRPFWVALSGFVAALLAATLTGFPRARNRFRESIEASIPEPLLRHAAKSHPRRTRCPTEDSRRPIGLRRQEVSGSCDADPVPHHGSVRHADGSSHLHHRAVDIRTAKIDLVSLPL